MGLLIVGSVALDNVTTPAGTRKESLGGAACYAGISASFFTEDIYLVGVVGGDFPQEHIEFLKSKKINLDGVEIIEGGKTFRWAGKYVGDMNQAETLDTQLNVFQNFQPKLPENHKNAEFVFLANIQPQLQLDVLKQAQNPKFTACDTMNLWINHNKDEVLEVIKNVNLVLINDAEARMLTGVQSLPVAAKHILESGPMAVIIKKGEHGVVLFTKEFTFFVPGYPLFEVKDPTGAGDTFAGGVMGFLASHKAVTPELLKKATVFGSVMASYNVEDFSLERMKTISIKDVENRFEEFKNLTSFL